VPHKPDDEECKILGVESSSAPEIFKPKEGGCSACNGAGYRGRVAIAEILLFDEDMDEVVARSGTKAELKAMAVERGFKSMKDDGILKILEGVTTIDALSKAVDIHK